MLDCPARGLECMQRWQDRLQELHAEAWYLGQVAQSQQEQGRKEREPQPIQREVRQPQAQP